MGEPLGFIGLGMMGLPMARNLLRAGHAVTVYNRTRSKAAGLAAEGARVGESPAAVGRSAAITLLNVLDEPALDEMLFAPDSGLVCGARPGSVVINLATISADGARRIGESLARHDLAFMDAPVIRGPRGAREGTLLILAGAEESVYQRCLPFLQVLGRDIIHTGSVGTSATIKLLNNMVSHLTLIALCETLALGTKAGADPAQVFQVLTLGSGNSYVLRDRIPGVLDRSFPLKAALNVAYKDLGLAVDLAAELGVPTPLAAIGRQVQQMARSLNLGDQDASSVVQVYEQFLGAEVRGRAAIAPDDGV